jgi:hypothetical protein
MNQTNKEEQSSAEPGEKRARAKENIVSFNTRPDTARGNRVCQGWSGVRGATLLVIHPRWEPYAGKPLVRFCAGGDQRWSSLPQHLRNRSHQFLHRIPPQQIERGPLGYNEAPPLTTTSDQYFGMD